MSSGLVGVLQQQSVSAHRSLPIRAAGAWQWWEPSTIASVCLCPLLNVEANWPLIYGALQKYGIASYNVCRAMIGTIAIESAHTFAPVREAFWMTEAWRAANLRYYPYYGRGFIQITWQDNYATYGNLIGADLVNNPDAALQPDVSALVAAAYFYAREVYVSAEQQNWPEVRRRVQGAYAGLEVLEQVVDTLDTLALRAS